MVRWWVGGARSIVALPPRALADKLNRFLVTAVGRESCERGSTFGIWVAESVVAKCRICRALDPAVLS